MITKNEVNKHILTGLKGPFNQLGFQANLKRQNFLRKRAYGRDIIHFAYVAVPKGIAVQPNLAIRINDLEDLIFENTSDYIPKDLRDVKSSLGCFLTQLMPDDRSKWLISEPDDVTPVINSLSNSLSTYGLPFFEKYSDKDFVFDLLVDNDRLANQICPVPINRALATVGLAFLNGDEEQFLRTARLSLMLLKPIPNSRIELLEELFTNLKSRLDS